MADIPVIFSAPMVRALLDGRKTMTRRLAWRTKKPLPDGKLPNGPKVIGCVGGEGFYMQLPSPWQKVKPGDRLWVRENWQLHSRATDLATVAYAATINESWSEAHNQFPAELAMKMKVRPFQEGWRPSIHMPRWASRLTLVVTAIKIERLQDISEADARAEGVEAVSMIDVPRQAAWSNRGDFAQLWNKLHGDDAWDANPEVVALTFTVHKQNMDAQPKPKAA